MYHIKSHEKASGVESSNNWGRVHAVSQQRCHQISPCELSATSYVPCLDLTPTTFIYKTKEDLGILQGLSRLTYYQVKEMEKHPEDLSERGMLIYGMFIKKVESYLGS